MSRRQRCYTIAVLGGDQLDFDFPPDLMVSFLNGELTVAALRRKKIEAASVTGEQLRERLPPANQRARTRNATLDLFMDEDKHRQDPPARDGNEDGQSDTQDDTFGPAPNIGDADFDADTCDTDFDWNPPQGKPSVGNVYTSDEDGFDLPTPPPFEE
eukprot:TRINITY_DN1901_c0_g1_i2.p2 TRINITY_DN1901_c0_g1~~TRINITY_DN1901_c0_g1_i2.p2  ORF type:complete len:167 (+),score=42.66 TRINITY_DN1901_c0_g1_i2:33-503(+)